MELEEYTFKNLEVLNMYKIGYLGFSYEMVEILSNSKIFDLQFVVCEKNRQNKELTNICETIGCKLYNVKKDIDILEIIDKNEFIIDFLIICKTTIIIHKPFLDRYDCFNFHSGNLSTNKGAHPIVWSVLLDEKETELSLHKINAKIDEGILIDTFKINLESDDTPSIIRKKLFKGVPYLLNSLNEYLLGNKQGIPINGGQYRRKVQEKDYTINEKLDTPRKIICKIKSQKDYKGAILIKNKTKYYIDDWFYTSNKNCSGKYITIDYLKLHIASEEKLTI